MTLVSDDVWRQAISAVDGEDFDTGYPQMLRGVFVEEYISQSVGNFEVEGFSKAVECITSDVVLRRLVKQDPIRRVADDRTYHIKRIERADGGMTVLVLSA